MVTFTLTSFGSDFWGAPKPLKHTHGRPTSIEAALWEMPGFPDWVDMARKLFPDYHPLLISVADVMTLIRETNTCSNLDFPVEVWIDEVGDFRIKVYEA